MGDIKGNLDTRVLWKWTVNTPGRFQEVSPLKLVRPMHAFTSRPRDSQVIDPIAVRPRSSVMIRPNVFFSEDDSPPSNFIFF